MIRERGLGGTSPYDTMMLDQLSTGGADYYLDIKAPCDSDNESQANRSSTGTRTRTDSRLWRQGVHFFSFTWLVVCLMIIPINFIILAHSVIHQRHTQQNLPEKQESLLLAINSLQDRPNDLSWMARTSNLKALKSFLNSANNLASSAWDESLVSPQHVTAFGQRQLDQDGQSQDNVMLIDLGSKLKSQPDVTWPTSGDTGSWSNGLSADIARRSAVRSLCSTRPGKCTALSTSRLSSCADSDFLFESRDGSVCKPASTPPRDELRTTEVTGLKYGASTLVEEADAESGPKGEEASAFRATRAKPLDEFSLNGNANAASDGVGGETVGSDCTLERLGCVSKDPLRATEFNRSQWRPSGVGARFARSDSDSLVRLLLERRQSQRSPIIVLRVGQSKNQRRASGLVSNEVSLPLGWTSPSSNSPTRISIRSDGNLTSASGRRKNLNVASLPLESANRTLSELGYFVGPDQATTGLMSGQVVVVDDKQSSREQAEVAVTSDSPLECNMRRFTYRATRSDGAGNKCSGLVTATICYGGCDTGEYADWLFPHKKSIHRVCTHGGRKRRHVRLSECQSASGSPISLADNGSMDYPEGFQLSLREYSFVDATSCVCDRCRSADTACVGSLTRPYLPTLASTEIDSDGLQQQPQSQQQQQSIIY